MLLRPKFHAKLLPKLSAAPELPRHMTDYSLFARNLSVFGQTHDWRIDPVTNKCADFGSAGLERLKQYRVKRC